MKGRITLCDAARALSNGTYDVLGGGKRVVHVPKFPAGVAIGILVELEFSSTEKTVYPLQIKSVDMDGKSTGLSLEGQVDRRKTKDAGNAYLAFNVGFKAEKPTTSVLSLVVNGEERDSKQIRLELVPQSQSAAPQA